MVKERLRWLDAARGIGILFVVLGHHSLPEGVAKYIWSFHVPLFFLLSGYIFGMEEPPGFVEFLKKKARTLIIPYLSLFMICYLYFFFVGSKYGEIVITDWRMPILGLLVGSANYLRGVFSPLWFLPCLFVVEIMFFCIFRLFGKWYALALIACSVLGFLSSLRQPLHFTFGLPWGIDVAFTAIVFYGAGCAIRGLNLTGKNALWAIVPIPVLLAVNFFVSQWNDMVNLTGNRYGNYLLFYVAAFAGIFAYILIARYLQWCKPLLFVGRNSLIIFGLHGLPTGPVRGLLRVVLKYPTQNFYNSVPWAIVFTVACMLILTPVIYLLNRRLYFMLGRFRPVIGW